MAQKGTYTAYNAVRPIEQNFSDNLAEAEDVQFRNKLQGQRERQQKNQENEKWANKLGTSLSAIKDTAIGINSVDEMNARVILKAKQQMREAYIDLKKDPSNVDAILKIKNLEQLPENLMAYQQKYSNYVQSIGKGLSEGKLSPQLNRNMLMKLDRTIGQNNGYFELAPDGSLVGVMIDPENDGYEFKTMAEVLDGSGLEQPIPRADYSGAQEVMKKMYSTHKNVSQTGFDTTTTVGLRPEDIEGLRNHTDTLWGDSVANMTDFAKSVIADGLGQDPSSLGDDIFSKYKRDFGDEIIGSFKTENSETTNLGAKNAANREARLRKGKTGSKENYLKTQVEGVLAGDEKYMENLVGTKIEEKGKDDKTISAIEKVNGKIIVEFSNGQIEEIDPSKDKDKAIGQLLKLARPSQNADERLGEYEQGSVLSDFTSTEKTGKSKIKTKALASSLNGVEREDALSKLKANGIKGFKLESGWFKKKIVGPDGTKYDLKKGEDVKQLEKYLLEEKAETENNSYGI